MERFFLLLMLLGITSIISCKKEDSDSPNTQLPTVRLSNKAKAYMPDSWRQARYVHYKNKFGESKKLKCTFLENRGTGRLDDKDYEFEQQSITLVDESDSNYRISILVQAQYENRFQTKELVSVGLLTHLNDGLFPFLDIILNNGNMNNPTLDALTLNDKAFTHVFENAEPFPLLQFSKIYYTKADGVIGFKAYNNELWVLDHIE